MSVEVESKLEFEKVLKKTVNPGKVREALLDSGKISSSFSFVLFCFSRLLFWPML
jgi:hypothetical protein